LFQNSFIVKIIFEVPP